MAPTLISMTQHHPTALIDSAAQLDADVAVGPYAIIEAGTVIGRGTVIDGHAQVLRGVTLGENCRVGHGAVLGGDPQSLAFDPRIASGVCIGNHNRFREHVTVHRSLLEGQATRIGDHNFFMAGSHVGHDAEIGSHNVLANAVLLAGHVRLGNRAFLGGGSVYHQFIRIGDFAMIQGNAGFSKDVAPYVIGSGINLIHGLNTVGLRRAGFDAATRQEIKSAFDLLFRSGKNFPQALAEARQQPWRPEAETLIAFVEAGSAKGVCPLAP